MKEPSRSRIPSKLYDEWFHPVDGLSRCEQVLHFLSESVSSRSERNYELSEDAAAGLVWILDLTATAMAEISQKVDEMLKERRRNQE